GRVPFLDAASAHPVPAGNRLWNAHADSPRRVRADVSGPASVSGTTRFPPATVSVSVVRMRRAGTLPPWLIHRSNEAGRCFLSPLSRKGRGEKEQPRQR